MYQSIRPCQHFGQNRFKFQINSEGFPCEISSLGALERGLDLDLSVHPAVPAPSGNVGIWPLGIEVEKQGFANLGLRSKKQGFRTAWLITGQKFQGVGLKLTAFILTFRDPSSHLCQKIMIIAKSGDLDFGSCSISQLNQFFVVI